LDFMIEYGFGILWFVGVFGYLSYAQKWWIKHHKTKRDYIKLWRIERDARWAAYDRNSL